MTERAKKLLLLYYKQSRKIRRVSGLPPLTFKAKKAGTLKNYRIYGNTETKTRSYSGSAPLSFPIADGSVSNYRIYGNTVNGGSVGDKTVNILPLSRTPITETHGDFLCEYDGLGTITLTTNKDKAATDGEFVIPLIQNFTIPVSIGQGGTGCFQINNSISGIATNNIKLYYNNTQIDTWNLNELNRVHSAYIGMSNKTIDSISVRINDSGTNRKITIKPAFVENVTEQVPFEPYGYRIPITNNSETENIYLDEPLRKVGDEAEYVDYAAQKWHRVRKNLVSDYNVNATKTRYDPALHCFADLMPNTNYIITFLMDSQTDFYTNEYVFEPTRYTNKLPGNKKLIVKTKETLNKNDIRQYRSAYGWIILKNNSEQTENPNISYVQIRLTSIEDDTYEPYIENTEVDVTIPALPAQSSTNSLSIGTTVQPSSVAVDVSEVVSCGDKVTDSQSVNYGKYKIPVTLTVDSAETTDIYLDTPLAKSGNNADYIDYETQKRHNSDGTNEDVTLPEITVTAGMNTLTVGTEVQPSGVEIKGRIKAAGGD